MSPLVSMCVPTYNQAGVVKETLASLFAQTYEPLEIVIGDDASTDGTADVIDAEVKKYLSNGGRHKVVFLRGEKNLGLLKNYEKVFSAAHGELLLDCGGDDASEPTRAEVVVKRWMDAGMVHRSIIHSGVRMDVNGKILGDIDISNRGIYRNCLGAVSVYHRDVIAKFPPVSESKAWEDVIFGYRASLLGETLRLDNKLVRYRVGAGQSSSRIGHRQMSLRIKQTTVSARRQALLDLESARSFLSSERYDSEKREMTRMMAVESATVDLLQGENIAARNRARKAIYAARGGRWQNANERFLTLLYLLPTGIADALLALMDNVRK